MIRFLLDIESQEDETLRVIRKGGTTTEDQRAIQLLRQYGIISMATYVVGFNEESCTGTRAPSMSSRLKVTCDRTPRRNRLSAYADFRGNANC